MSSDQIENQMNNVKIEQKPPDHPPPPASNEAASASSLGASID